MATNNEKRDAWFKLIQHKIDTGELVLEGVSEGYRPRPYGERPRQKIEPVNAPILNNIKRVRDPRPGMDYSDDPREFHTDVMERYYGPGS